MQGAAVRRCHHRVPLPSAATATASLLPRLTAACPPLCSPPASSSLPTACTADVYLGARMAAQQLEEQQEGLYCSTAGTYFQSKQDLEDHYRSDFHR